MIELKPGVGAGPVLLGMSSSEVLAVMGEPERRSPDWLHVGERWSWLRSCFQVCLGGSRTVGEIQLCYGGPITVIYAGIDLLGSPADLVVEQLSRFDEGRYEEGGSSYSLPRLGLAFWRQCLPGEEPEDDPQYRGGRYWDTVTTGTDDYRAEFAAAVRTYTAEGVHEEQGR